ncbi:CbbQ/NirQ/NorQ C-terminal domain-containing protein, partial [Brucella abortus]|nr:CbbQ/NirQ/NorQ C-terminal domain-containing protein [Brucella abortus]
APLVDLAHRLRALKGHDARRRCIDPSSRLLRGADRSGMSQREAARAAMIEPLTDEPDVKAALLEIADAMLK